MSAEHLPRPRLRASDADRERIAGIVQAATGAGRLTATEADERLAAVYAARFTDEFEPLIDDLPPEPPPPPVRPALWRGPLAVHAAVVVAVSTLLVLRWLASGVPFFWPAAPMVWLGISLLAHARIRARRTNRRLAFPSTPRP